MKWLTIRPAVHASLSHPARGAWIEISRIVSMRFNASVAPRKGCVD